MDSVVKKESGFFKQSHLELCKVLSENDLKTFSSLTGDEDQFKFIYTLINEKVYPFDQNIQSKCEFEARKMKENGNKYFQAANYSHALRCYSKAVLKCPLGKKEDMAVLRANRSAALYHLELYKPALYEIEAATSLGYPKELVHKIKDRKARCFLALKQHKSAIQAFKETLVSLDDSKLTCERRQKWQKDIQIMIAMLTKSNVDNEIIKETSKTVEIVDKNPVYKAAHSSVSIKYETEVGRYAEANKRIRIGDVILTEEPHCAVLLEENAQTHCFQCFKRLIVSEPCPTCSRVAFCSKKCSSEALKTHHKFECSILETLWASGASVTCLMALRIILQRPLHFFTQLKLEGSLESVIDIYQASDYKTVYKLISHKEKRSVGDLIHRAHMAVFLFLCLEKSGYFKDGLVERDELTEALIGGLILRHLQLLQFNAHEVSELETENLEKTRSIFLGGAVYPTLALFNHSCNPSITRYFQGTKVVVRAIRNIKPGELIAENYGPIFTQNRKADRKQALKTQYWFDCSCEACLNDWPLIDDMDTSVLRFRCEGGECGSVINVPINTMEFMIKCHSCSKQINILKGLKVLQETETIFRLGRSLMDEGKSEEALKKFIELLEILDDTLAPPFKDYHICQQAIRTCFLTQGNRNNERFM